MFVKMVLYQYKIVISHSDTAKKFSVNIKYKFVKTNELG